MAKKPTKAAVEAAKNDQQQKLMDALGAKSPTSSAPLGRPSVYRPEMCEQVIEWGKLGKSRTWMAASLGVRRETLWDWENKFPEFSNALAIAEHHAQVWWEDAGQTGMLLPGFNASIWSRSMAARFPKDWRETKNAEITGKDGGAIQLNVQRIDVDNLPARALDALEQALEILENPEEDDGEVIEGEAVEDGED